MNPIRPHWLPTNDGSRVPTSLVFVDTESFRQSLHGGKLERLTFRLGSAVYVRRDRRKWTRRDALDFADPAAFWDWLLSKQDYCRTLWLFAHNVGHDLTQLGFWDRLDDGTFSLKDVREKPTGIRSVSQKKVKPWRGTLIAADPPTIISVTSRKGILKCVDTMNYWRVPLHELAVTAGTVKLPCPGENAAEAEVREYCRRDAEVLASAVCQLVDKWDAAKSGVWDATAAGLAFHAFRHVTPPKSIWIDHGEPHTALARAGYYGGQCEAYYCGRAETVGRGKDSRRNTSASPSHPRPQGPFYYLDARSFYPWIMRTWLFPVRIRTVAVKPSILALRATLHSFLGIAHVRLETPNLGYPVRRNGQVSWPVGNYWTTLAGPELEAALQRGHVADCALAAYYHPGQPFTRFVDAWWDRRARALASGDRADADFCKLVMDSLSGKFAQHAMRWHDAPELPAAERWGEWIAHNTRLDRNTIFRGIAGHTQEFLTDGEGRNAHVAISAFITAHGRSHMESLRALCPAGSCLYQDTDSLLVTAAGRDAVLAAAGGDDLTLGAMRIVWQADAVELFGPKVYSHDNKIVAAGVPKQPERLVGGELAVERWQRLNDLLKRKPDPAGLVSKVRLKLTGGEGNRRRTRSGWTQPIRLDSAEPMPF